MNVREGIIPARCPGCYQLLDAATSMAPEHRPGPGDWTVCVYCAAVLVFDEECRAVTPTRVEIAVCPDEVLRIAAEVSQAPMRRQI